MSKSKPPVPSATPIGDAIRATIRARGLTAYRVKQLSGVSIDSTQRFLDGQRDLKLASAEKIATALGIQVIPPKE